jgi:uncharacterized protein YcfJ
MHFRVFVLAGMSALAAGCESMGAAAQSETVQGAALGTAVGAGTGAIVGHQTGHAGEGAAVGAGLGALGGGLIGHGLEGQERGASAPSAGTPTKVCPIGGELYRNDIRYCPIHGAELRVQGS